MTDKELKKLSRAELLELLLVQSKEIEHLRSRLEKAEQRLADRELRVQEAGDIAQAALAVNGVMEAAQAAAKQYLDNIARMEQETQQQCRKMLEDAQAEADRIITDANKQQEADAEPLSKEERQKSLRDLLGEVRELIGDDNE